MTEGEKEAPPATIYDVINHPRMMQTQFFYRPVPRNVNKEVKKAQDMQTQQLLNMMSNHIEELLEVIFEETPTVTGTRAYRIMQHGDDILINQLIDGSRLQIYATRIVHKIPMHPLRVARLCGLALATIMLKSDKISQACGFLFQLLPFIDETAVLDLFEVILGNAPKFEEAQKWLVSVGLSQIIVQEMKRTDPADPKMAGFYRLLKRGRKSDLIFHHFACSQVISALATPNDSWKDERWEAMVSLYCPATRDPLRTQFLLAVAEIKEEHDSVMKRQVTALALLTKILQEDLEMRPFFAMSGLAPICIKQMRKFPHHSMLLMAIYRFTEAVLSVDEVAADYAPEMILACMEEAKEKRSIALSASGFMVVYAARKAEKESTALCGLLKTIEGYDSFVNKELKKYVDLSKRKYGGDTKPPEPAGKGAPVKAAGRQKVIPVSDPDHETARPIKEAKPKKGAKKGLLVKPAEVVAAKPETKPNGAANKPGVEKVAGKSGANTTKSVVKAGVAPGQPTQPARPVQPARSEGVAVAKPAARPGLIKPAAKPAVQVQEPKIDVDVPATKPAVEHPEPSEEANEVVPEPSLELREDVAVEDDLVKQVIAMGIDTDIDVFIDEPLAIVSVDTQEEEEEEEQKEGMPAWVGSMTIDLGDVLPEETEEECEEEEEANGEQPRRRRRILVGFDDSDEEFDNDGSDFDYSLYL